MKVKQLIKKLQALPQNADVVIYAEGGSGHHWCDSSPYVFPDDDMIEAMEDDGVSTMKRVVLTYNGSYDDK